MRRVSRFPIVVIGSTKHDRLLKPFHYVGLHACINKNSVASREAQYSNQLETARAVGNSVFVTFSCSRDDRISKSLAVEKRAIDCQDR